MGLIDSIAQTQLQAGQSIARGQRERGQIIGNTLASLGQLVANIPGQMQQAKHADQQQQAADLQMQAARGQLLDQARERQQQDDVTRIFQQHQGDVDGAIDELMTVHPQLGLEFHKRQMEAKTSALNFREGQLKAQKAQTEYLGQLAGGATDQASYVQRVYEAQQAGLDVSGFPPEYEQAKPQIENLKRAALTEQQRVEAAFKQIDDERQAAAARETARHNLATEQTVASDKTADNARLDATAKETGRHNLAMEQAAMVRAKRPAASGGASANTSDIKETVAGMIDGTLPPILPGRATKEYNALLAEAHRQGFDLAGAATDWAATQKHISTLNGSQQLRLNQSINQLPELLDSVDALAGKWKGGQFPILNRANLALAKNGAYGDQVASVARQLDAQIADVTADLGNVYMGGNSPTDHALSLAAKSLSGDWSQKVLQDMVTLARKNVQTRLNSIRNTGVAGASADNPYAPPQASPTVKGRFNPATGKVEPIK